MGQSGVLEPGRPGVWEPGRHKKWRSGSSALHTTIYLFTCLQHRDLKRTVNDVAEEVERERGRGRQAWGWGEGIGRPGVGGRG